MKNCDKCRAENPDDALFCGQCGAPLGCADVQELVEHAIADTRVVTNDADGNSGRVYARLEAQVGEKAIPLLVDLLVNNDPNVRWQVLRLLIHFRYANAERLGEFWKAELVAGTRKLLLRAVEYLKDEMAVPLLTMIAAGDSDYSIRQGAIEALARRVRCPACRGQVTAALREALVDNHPFVRMAAINQLAVLGLGEVAPWFGELLAADPDANVRCAAAHGLAQVGGQETIAIVYEAFALKRISDSYLFVSLKAYKARFGKEPLTAATATLEPADVRKAVLDAIAKC